MIPSCNKTTGMNVHFPDVVKAPAPPLPFIPVPLPNMGAHAMAVPFAPTILLMMSPALNMLSVIPMTNLDEAGILGGLISQIIKGPSMFNMGSPIVMVMFVPGITLLCPSSGNMCNAMLGAALIPDICITVLFGYAGVETAGTERHGEPSEIAHTNEQRDWLAPRKLDVDALRGLSDAVQNHAGDEHAAVSSTMLDEGVCLLRVRIFECDVSRPVFNELEKYDSSALQLLVIDLRGNRGGDVDAAFDLADDFLPVDTVLAQSCSDGEEPEPVHARHDEPYTVPVVLMIDEHTASAAEIFAAALQHHGRAVVIGSQSVGKTTAHRVVLDSEGDPLYVPVCEYRRPDGSRLHGRGVEPDVLVPNISPDRVAVEAAAAQRGSRPVCFRPRPEPSRTA